MGGGGREVVVLDFDGGGEISSVSSALPKDPSSILAFEEPDQSIAFQSRAVMVQTMKCIQKDIPSYAFLYTFCFSIFVAFLHAVYNLPHTWLLFRAANFRCCSSPRRAVSFENISIISVVPTTFTNNLREKSVPLAGWISPCPGCLLFRGGEAVGRFF